MSPNLKNPYVGPRTFQREDRNQFFGRDREARDLMALVSSERLILFYAQSGAGKSSLLNTRLIPELEDNGIEVLPVGRIQGEISTDVEIDNIYVYNLLSSIVQQKTDLESIAHVSLSQFLAVLEFNENGYLYNQGATPPANDILLWRRVLIIDQFEEIFTTHLDAWKKREDFFSQLAQAMKDDASLTVILVMREDYIASLDPYAHILFGELRTRYYMQRLTRDMALKAVKNPVEQVRPFADGVAERLVEDLASILVHRPGDVQEIHSGQYVEPVQLQVVCYSLWDRLPSEGNQITEDDLTEVGDVDQSLERFYDQRVAAVAQAKEVPERTIREWFGKELITSNKTRNMVLRGANGKSMIREDVIQSLKGDLVREELRAGQIWYELTHDRLVEPVLASNAKWFEKHLSLFQRQAALWMQQGRSEGLLLRYKELQQAERESGEMELTADESTFLDASRAHRARKQRERRRNTLMTVLAIGATAAMIVAWIFWTQAQNSANDAQEAASTAQTASTESVAQKNIAEIQKAAAQAAEQDAVEARSITESTLKKTEIELRKARNQQLSAQAELTSQDYSSRSLLLALEAIKINADDDDPVTFTAKQALLNGLANSQGTPLSGNTSTILTVKFSPDGRWLVTGARDGSIKVWDRQNPDFTKTPTHLLETGDFEISHLEFSSDGQMLAGTGKSGGIYLWDFVEGERPRLLTTLETGLQSVEELKISPDGYWLAAGNGDDEKILLWDLKNIEPEKRPREFVIDEVHSHDAEFGDFGFEFSLNGYYLLARNGNHFKLFDFTVKDLFVRIDNSYTLVFTPEHPYGFGSWEPGTAERVIEPIWAGFIKNNNNIIAAFPHQPPLTESLTLQWQVDSFLTKNYQPRGYGDKWIFSSNATSLDGRWYATSSGSEIKVRNFTSNKELNLNRHEGLVTDLIFSHDGHWLVSASALNPSPNVRGDGSLWIWDLTAEDVQKSGKAYKFNSDSSAIDIDPRGEWVAVGSENQLVRLIALELFKIGTKEYYEAKYGLDLPDASGFHDISSFYDFYENCLGTSPDGRWLKYTDFNYSGYLLDTMGNDSYKVEGVCSSYFSPDSKWFIAPDEDGIKIYNLQGPDSNLPFKYYAKSMGVQLYFPSNDGKLFFAGSGGVTDWYFRGDNWIPVWTNAITYIFDLRDQAIEVKELSGIQSFAVSPDSKWMAGVFTDQEGDFAVYDLSRQNPAGNAIVLLPSAIHLGYPEEEADYIEIEAVSFSPDSQWITLTTCCVGERKIHLWNFLVDDPISTEYVLTVPAEEEVLFSKDARWIGILAGGVGKLIDLSQTAVKEIDFQKFVPTGAIKQISFSPDSRWLALLDELGRITLVDLQAPNLGAINPNVLFYQIEEINFDQESNILSGSTILGDTLIWEIASLLENPDAFPLISKGGTYTTSAGKWLFSLTYDELLKAVCPTIGRNLTKSEWEQYGFTEEYRVTCPQFPPAQE